MWQFGGETNKLRDPVIAGYVVDQDYCYEDYPSIMKNAGLNGFAKAGEDKEKTIDELAREVIAGQWKTGSERKRLLTEAGYDYDAVQKRVNELI